MHNMQTIAISDVGVCQFACSVCICCKLNVISVVDTTFYFWLWNVVSFSDAFFVYSWKH